MALRFLNSGYFAGSVGIGEESPDYKLDIGGTAASTDNTVRLMQNNGGTAIRVGSGGGSSDVVLLRIDGNSAAGGHDGATDLSNYGFSFKYFGIGGGNNNRFGILSDNQVAATQVEAITILQDGFIGIGNIAPVYKLDVTGSVQSYITATRYIRLQGASADFEVVSDNNTKPVSRITGTGTADLFQIFDNTTEVFTVLDGGNVGIGTASPLGKLQVNEYTVASQGNQGVHGEVSVFANDGDESLFLGLKDSAYPNRGWAINPVAYGINSSLQIKEHGSTAVRMTIQSGGNVGIGTTNPSEKLQVNGTIKGTGSTSRLILDNIYGQSFQVYAWTGGINVYNNAASAPSVYFGRDAGTANSFYFTRNGTNHTMKIDTANERVGIGTVSPSEKLEVNGNVKIKDALLSNQENTDIDSAAAEVVAQVAHATYTAAFFDFVVKKGTNVRSGTVYACHNGDTTPLVEFTETSTNDLGDTSDVTLSVDISGTNMRLVATVTSDDWSVKSLIRAI